MGDDKFYSFQTFKEYLAGVWICSIYKSLEKNRSNFSHHTHWIGEGGGWRVSRLNYYSYEPGQTNDGEQVELVLFLSWRLKLGNLIWNSAAASDFLPSSSSPVFIYSNFAQTTEPCGCGHPSLAFLITLDMKHSDTLIITSYYLLHNPLLGVRVFNHVSPLSAVQTDKPATLAPESETPSS